MCQNVEYLWNCPLTLARANGGKRGAKKTMRGPMDLQKAARSLIPELEQRSYVPRVEMGQPNEATSFPVLNIR